MDETILRPRRRLEGRKGGGGARLMCSAKAGVTPSHSSLIPGPPPPNVTSPPYKQQHAAINVHLARHEQPRGQGRVVHAKTERRGDGMEEVMCHGHPRQGARFFRPEAPEAGSQAAHTPSRHAAPFEGGSVSRVDRRPLAHAKDHDACTSRATRRGAWHIWLPMPSAPLGCFCSSCASAVAVCTGGRSRRRRLM